MKTTPRFDFPCLPAHSTFTVRLMLTLGGGEVKAKKTPVNLSLVIDKSGSMQGEKIAKVKEAACMIAGMLKPYDIFSLVAFNDKAEVIVPAAKGADLDGFENLITKIMATGNTNLDEGYRVGLELACECNGIGTSRVVILSDGQANVGQTSPVELAKLARGFREKEISTTTFGVGYDFDENLLALIAEEGGGSANFIEHPYQAAEVFREELDDLRSIVCTGTTVRFNPAQSVVSYVQLNNYPETDSQGWLIGDIYATRERRLILELVVKTGEEAAELNIGDFFLYSPSLPEGKLGIARKIPVVLPVIMEKEFEGYRPDHEVTVEASLLAIGRAKREAMELARRQQFVEAANLIDTYIEALFGLGLHDPELDLELERLKERSWQLRNRGAAYFNAAEQKYFAYEADLAMKGKKEKYLAMMARKDNLKSMILGYGATVVALMPKGNYEFAVDNSSGRTVADFLNEIYENIKGDVASGSYGKMWLLRDKATGRTFDIGTSWARAEGLRSDQRTLDEVGLTGDIYLEAVQIPTLVTSRKPKVNSDIVMLDLSLICFWGVIPIDFPFKPAMITCDFLAQAYKFISTIVPPNAYGREWVLRDAGTGRILDCGSSWARAHKVQIDIRPIGKIGIRGGAVLQLVRVNN